MSTDENQTLKSVAANGTQFFYTEQGKEYETAIVMIHAGICDQRMWQTQVSHFAQQYHVVTLDLRGFGKSQPGNNPYQFHEDVVAVMDHLSIKQTWVLAASMGGAVALDLALTHPDRVQGLILSAPALGGYQYTGTPHSLKSEVQEAEERGDVETVSELEVQMWVDGVGRIPSQVDANVRRLVYEMNLIPLRQPDAFWEREQEIDPPAIERLGEINVPTLILIGSLDIAPSQERATLLMARISGAEIATMTGTAHLPNMEQPEAFNAIVGEFLAKHSQR